MALPTLSEFASQNPTDDPLDLYKRYSDYTKTELLKAGEWDDELVNSIDQNLIGKAQVEGLDLGTDPLATFQSRSTEDGKLREVRQLASDAYDRKDEVATEALRQYASALTPGVKQTYTDPVAYNIQLQQYEEAAKPYLSDPEAINRARRRAMERGETPVAVVKRGDSTDVELSPTLLSYVGDDQGLGMLLENHPEVPRDLIPAIRQKLSVPEGYKAPVMAFQRQADFFTAAEKDYSTYINSAADSLSKGDIAAMDGVIQSAMFGMRNSFGGQYTEDELRGYFTDAVKLRANPDLGSESPLMELSTGQIVAPLNLAFDKQKFDAAINSAAIPEVQKARLREDRVAQLDSAAPSIFGVIAGYDENFAPFKEKMVREGKSNAEILDTWNANPERKTANDVYLSQAGAGVKDALVGIPLSIAALAGSDTAKQIMYDHMREDGARRAYSQLMGRNTGVGYDLMSVIPQLGADIAISVATGGVGAELAASRVTARTALKASMKGMFGAEAKGLASRYVRNIADDVTADQVYKLAARDMAAYLTPKLTEAAFLGTAFTRSAGSAYASISSALEAKGVPPDQVRSTALGHALIAGTITAAVTKGMSVLGQGGMESIFDDLSRPQLNRVFNKVKAEWGNLSPAVREGINMERANAMLASIMTKAVKPIFSTALTRGAGEAVEEGLDQFAQNINQSLATGDKVNLAKAAQEAGYAAMLGGAMGAGIPAIRDAYTGVTGKEAPQVLQDAARTRLFNDTAAKLDKHSPQTAALMRALANQAPATRGVPEAVPPAGPVEAPSGQTVAGETAAPVVVSEAVPPGEAASASQPEQVEYFNFVMGEPEAGAPATPVVKTREQLDAELEGIVNRYKARKGPAIQLEPIPLQNKDRIYLDQLPLQNPDRILLEPMDLGDIALYGRGLSTEGNRILLERVKLTRGRGAQGVPPAKPGEAQLRAAAATPTLESIVTQLGLPMNVEGRPPTLSEVRQNIQTRIDRVQSNPQLTAEEKTSGTEGLMKMLGDTEQLMLAAAKPSRAGTRSGLVASADPSTPTPTTSEAQAQVPQASAPVALEGQPSQPPATGGLEEGAAQRSGEGEEGVVDPEFQELQGLTQRRGQAQNKVKGVKFTAKDETRFKDLSAKFRDQLFEATDPASDPVVGVDINGTNIQQSKTGTFYTFENGRVRTGPAFSENTPAPTTGNTVEEIDITDVLAEPPTPVEVAATAKAPEIALREDPDTLTQAKEFLQAKGVVADGLSETDIAKLIQEEFTPRKRPEGAAKPGQIRGELERHNFSQGLTPFLQSVAKSGEPRYRDMAKLLLGYPELLANTMVTLVDMPNSDYAGAMIPSTGQIVVNEAGLGPRGAVDTVIHELLHAATVRSLVSPTEAQRKFIARLDRLRETVSRRAAAEGITGMEYALGSNDEFITHWFTSPRFQEQVGKLTLKGERNLIQVILDTIKSLIIGKPLSQIDRRISELMDEMLTFTQGALETTWGTSRMDQLMQQPPAYRDLSRMEELQAMTQRTPAQEAELRGLEVRQQPAEAGEQDNFAIAEEKFNRQIDSYVTGNWTNDPGQRAEELSAFARQWAATYVSVPIRVESDAETRSRFTLRASGPPVVVVGGANAISLVERAGLTETQAKRLVASEINEEVIHYLHHEQVRSRLGEGATDAQVTNEIKNLYLGMLSSPAFAGAAYETYITYKGEQYDPEVANDPGPVLREVLRRYPEEAYSMAYETVRQAVQLRNFGTITEELTPSTVERLIQWFRDRLAALKSFAAKTSVFGDRMEKDILATERALQQLTGDQSTPDIRFQPAEPQETLRQADEAGMADLPPSEDTQHLTDTLTHVANGRGDLRAPDYRVNPERKSQLITYLKGVVRHLAAAPYDVETATTLDRAARFLAKAKDNFITRPMAPPLDMDEVGPRFQAAESPEDREGYFAAEQDADRERESLISNIVALLRSGKPYIFRGPDGRDFMFTRSSKPDHPYQVTHKDKNGPMADTPVYSLDSLSRDASPEISEILSATRPDIPDDTGFNTAYNGRTFLYELKGRPAGPGAVPSGFLRSTEGGKYGVAEFDRILTQKEIADFELKPVGFREPATPDIRFQPADPENLTNYVHAWDGYQFDSLSSDQPQPGFLGTLERIFTQENDMRKPWRVIKKITDFMRSAAAKQGGAAARPLKAEFDKAIKAGADPDKLTQMVGASLGTTAPMLTEDEAIRIHDLTDQRLLAAKADLEARTAAAMADRGKASRSESIRSKKLKKLKTKVRREGKKLVNPTPEQQAEYDALVAEQTTLEASLMEARGKLKTLEDTLANLETDHAAAVQKIMEDDQKERILSELEFAKKARTAQDLAMQDLTAAHPELAKATGDMRSLLNAFQDEVYNRTGHRPELQMKIDRSRGIYLVRSYRLHQDPSLGKRILEDPKYKELRDRTITFFKQKFADQWVAKVKDAASKSAQQIDSEAGELRLSAMTDQLRKLAVYANYPDSDLRKVAEHEVEQQARHAFEDFIIGRTSMRAEVPGLESIKVDAARFMQKGNVPKEIRDALLENTDPLFNATHTFNALANIVVQHDMLTRFRDAGMKQGWLVDAEGKAANKDLYKNWEPVVTANDANAAWSAMAGIYAAPEDIEAFHSAFKSGAKRSDTTAARLLGSLNKKLTGFAGLSLGIVTQGNPAYYTRNILNGTIIMAALGINPIGAAKAFKNLPRVLKEESGTFAFDDMHALRNVALGLVQGGSVASDVQSLMQQYDTDPVGAVDKMHALMAERWPAAAALFGKGRDAQAKALDALGNLAAMSEGFVSHAAFEDNVRMLTKAKFGTQEDIFREAARRTLRVTPARSESPQALTAFTQSGLGALVAPFIRFKADMVRITWNLFADAITDMKSDNPVIRAHGQKVFASASTVVVGLTSVLPMIAAAVAGIGDDEDRAIRAALPDYAKNSSFIYWRDPKNPKQFLTFDLTFLNSYSFVVDPFTQAFTSIRRGRFNELPELVARTFGQEIFGENVVAGAVMDVKRNIDEGTKRPIYLESDTFGDKTQKSLAHIFDSAYNPAAIKKALQFQDSFSRTSKGDENFWYTPQGVLLGTIAPFKPRVNNVDDLNYRAMAKLRNAKSQLWQISAPLKSPAALSTDKARDIVDDRVEATRRIASEGYELVQGFRKLGMTDREIMQNMVDSGSSDRSSKLLMQGYVMRPVMDKESLQKIYSLSPERYKAIVDQQDKHAVYLKVSP